MALGGMFYSADMKYDYGKIHELVTRAYLDARRQERKTQAQLSFEVALEEGIASLSRDLSRRTWRPGPMRWFVLEQPTIREVFAPSFRDRVVSHVLFNLISPIFERYFIYDSFSCRKEKGTLFGIERFEHHIRSVSDNYRREAWCLNIDISGYFMSINRERLYKIIQRTLGKHREAFPGEVDYEFVDYLIRSYLYRDPTIDCVFVGKPKLVRLVPPGKSLFSQPEGTGIPIGDVGNQLNSNIYLNELDQFVKRELKARHYCRYVDDCRIIRDDYYALERDKERIQEFLQNELLLTLHPDKTCIKSVYDVNLFLGAAIRPWRRLARVETLKKFRGYIRHLEKSSGFSPEEELPRLNSHLGYLAHFDEYREVKKTLDSAPAVLSKYKFDNNYSKALIK